MKPKSYRPIVIESLTYGGWWLGWTCRWRFLDDSTGGTLAFYGASDLLRRLCWWTE